MPELIEIESYRQAAELVVGRTVRTVVAPDAWFLKGGATPPVVVAAVERRTVVGTGRRGKLMWLDLDDGVRLGLRFGMTGRIVVDGVGPVEVLEYGPARQDPAWDRFALEFVRGGRLVVSDPRRLGGVELDPDLGRLGPEASTVSRQELAAALAGSAAPLKAVLLDQSRLAGVGNLIADETLWRAGLDPGRPASGLGPDEVAVLARTLRSTVRMLTRRGGSHTGDLQDQRHRAGHCPRCGAPLERRTVGGRTTYSCPAEQR